MRAVVDGLRAQKGGRVVDRIAGQVLRLERLTVQDVVGDDAVRARADAHLGRQWPDVLKAATVGPHAVKPVRQRDRPRSSRCRWSSR